MQEKANGQVVVGLVHFVVQCHCFFVIESGFLVYSNGEVGVSQILEVDIFAGILKALLQDTDRLRITSKDVQGCSLVVTDMHRELVGLGGVLQLFKHIVAQIQTLLRLPYFKVQVRKILSGRKIVACIFDSGFKERDGFVCRESQGFNKQGERISLLFF